MKPKSVTDIESTASRNEACVAAAWDRAFARVRIERGLQKPPVNPRNVAMAAAWDAAFARALPGRPKRL